MSARKVSSTYRVRLSFFCILICISFLPSFFAENDFFVSVERTNDYYHQHWKCFTNSSYAISWITPLTDKNSKNYVSSFPPNKYATGHNQYFPCSFGDTEDCNQYWTVSGSRWFIANSLKTNQPTLPIDHLILDRRWEGIENIFTTGPTGASGELYYTFATEIKMQNFKIPISIRTEEGHIFICDRNDTVNSNCYWFILQGWDKEKSAIRKCEGNLPTRNDVFQCRNRKDLKEEQHPAGLPQLSKNVWRHFEIVKTNTKISIMQMESQMERKYYPVIEYYPKNENLIDVKYVIITSKLSNGLWKVHSYDYLYTTESNERSLGPPIDVSDGSLCLAMYVTMCTSCRMTLFLSNLDRSIKYKEQTYLWEVSGWSEIKYFVTNMSSTEAQLYVVTVRSTDRVTQEEPFWAIANVRFCQNNEFRSISLDSIQSEGATCQLMSDSNNVLQVKLSAKTTSIDSDCPENTFGPFCVPCRNLDGNDCSRKIGTNKFGAKLCSRNIYDATICSCAAGFYGDYCEFECQKGFYGHGCQKECGYCESVCSNVNGYCVRCKEPFLGSTCEELPGLIFRKPPTVKNVTYSSCIIEVSDFTVLGKTTDQPDSYVINYYKPTESDKEQDWQAFGEIYKIDNDKATTTIEVTNLEQESKYFIRLIALAKDGSSYNGSYVKYVECKTKCKDISESDIRISHQSTSANVILLMNQLTCKSKTYDVEIKEKGRSGRYRKAKTSGTNDFQFDGLQPYTIYLVRVTISTGEILNHNFTTDEDAPGPVNRIQLNSATGTSLAIQWEEPSEKNGHIRYYLIKHKKQSHLSCGGSLNSDWSEPIKKIFNDTSALIADLEPYVRYTVAVSAFTIKEGIEEFGYFDTASLDSITRDEVPSIWKIAPGDSNITIVLNKPNCNVFKGSIDLHFNATCNSEWCVNVSKVEIAVIHYVNDKEIPLKGLYPFSQYTLKLKACRSNGQCSDAIQETVFKTKSAVPNKVKDLLVYSKDRTYIAIRWKPPYPPTGNIQGYFIRWSPEFPSNKKPSSTTDFQPCQLWPDFSCANLTGLPKLSYITKYNIEVTARNEEPFGYGRIKEINVWPKKEEPQPPYDLAINWSDKNDLEMSWKHPNETNGELELFSIAIWRKDNQANDPVLTENYTIEHTIYMYNYTCKGILEPSVNYHIEVASFNGFFSKKPVPFLEDTSPPPLLYFSKEPETKTTNTTITLELYLEHIDQSNLEDRFFRVFIAGPLKMVSQQQEEIENMNLSNYKHLLDQDLMNSDKFINFTIGENQTENIKLYPGTSYSLKVVVVNVFNKKMRNKVYDVEASTLGVREYGEPISASGNGGLYALLLLVLILPILFFSFRNRTKLINRYNTWKKSLLDRNSHEELVMNGSKENDIPLTNDTETKGMTKVIPVKMTENIKSISKQSEENPLHSKRIKITDFEQYVKDSIYSGELERQHKLFPRGQTKPWDYAMLKINKIKNRYNNLLAYDHTRVILEKINDDQYSDYINANYVDGYKIRKAYIATQGPKMNTLNDFWRMIWQENVEHIFMLANIYENGKKKVEKYWPDINDELQFGNITVQYCSNEVFADYEYRMFNVTQNDEVRKIDQLHFTTWPDHGVPMYAQSLVPYLQKMLKIPVSSKSPAVVHCSAGVGRTGTVILCDIALRMAAREGAVNFLNILKELRDQRANLVDNVEQYKLAHLVVLECLVGMHTSIPCGELEEVVKNIMMNDGIRTQMRYLNDTAWQDHAMQTIGQLACKETIPTVANKNRYQHSVSDSSLKQIFLPRYPVDDETSTYINAVKVDGFQCPGRFIVTQQPLPNTVGDFWRLAESSNASIIISLNKVDIEDKSSCYFWPDQDNPEMKPVDYITLRFNATQSLDHYDIVTIHMHLHNEEEYSKMQIIHMKNWAPQEDVPKGVEEFLTFWEESDVLCRRSIPIIVTCHDGIKASGVFVALSFIIEKIKLEQLCDVCQATRAVRHSRSQFINEEQFTFLYDAAVKYVNGFQSYSNFS